MLKRLLKICALAFGLIMGLLIVTIVYIQIVSKTDPPQLPTAVIAEQKIAEIDSGLWVAGNNWFRKSESGLYELYVEGAPY